MKTDYDHMIVERRGRVVMLTLNRPDSLNAVNEKMHSSLEQVFADLASDDSIGAVLITGAGRAFCVGGDIKEMAAAGAGGQIGASPDLITAGALRLVRNLLSIPQPIISAVNGDAIGMGATLALLGDIVLASESARFGDPHVKVGLVAGDGGAVIWPLLAGLNRAKEYLMTGDLIPALEAERIGLINHVYPKSELMNRATELAERLADGPPQAIRWTKQAVNKALRVQAELILETSLALEAISAILPDHAEGVRAFIERRKPRFSSPDKVDQKEAP